MRAAVADIARMALKVVMQWGLAAVVAAGPAAASPPVLTLHYQERAPYSVHEADGRVGGLVATPATRALERAGIAFTWQRTPAQRQLALIQQGDGLHCGVGWFRTPEREALGRFSAPLYRDQPFVALTAPAALLPLDAAGATRATDLLSQMAARLIVKEGYSYGPYLDALIARAPAPVLRTSAEVDAIARIVAAGRADWMIASAEEVPVLLAALRGTLPAPRVVRLVDVPAGPARHLYCNRAVPAEWLVRVDRVLAPSAP